MRKFGFILTALVSLLFSCTDTQEAGYRNDYVGGAFGTTYSIITISPKAMDLQSEIDSVFAVINKSLSTYIPESDISKINSGDSTVVVDQMFQEVFTLSKEIYTKTEGFFDPTVGTLVNAWGFGPEGPIEMDSVKVDSLLNYVGFDKVRLNAENRINKDHQNIYLDFNAIAKGYAIDRLAAMLDTKGIKNYLIEVGGELVAKGKNTIKDTYWVVGIDDPEMTVGRKVKLVINLNNRALASSGNYRKFRIDEATGKKYVHTINPKTGFTKSSNTLAVTVLANNCATADAYATAFMAMDLDDVYSLIDKNKDLEAYIVYLDEEGKAQEFLTKGFKALVKE